MKVLTLTLIFACSLAAQTVTTTEADKWRTTKKGWKQVAETIDSPVTYWFYKDFVRRGDNVEVWMKMYEPEQALRIAKMIPKSRRQYAHQLQLMTFHCESRAVSMKPAIVYDTLGGVIGLGQPGMTREPIPPETSLEIMHKHFCVGK
jgi:hypothetical protein